MDSNDAFCASEDEKFEVADSLHHVRPSEDVVSEEEPQSEENNQLGSKEK